jgi:hypothetical protein
MHSHVHLHSDLDLSPQQRTVRRSRRWAWPGRRRKSAGCLTETVRMHLRGRARLGARNTAHAVLVRSRPGSSSWATGRPASSSPPSTAPPGNGRTRQEGVPRSALRQARPRRTRLSRVRSLHHSARRRNPGMDATSASEPLGCRATLRARSSTCAGPPLCFQVCKRVPAREGKRSAGGLAPFGRPAPADSSRLPAATTSLSSESSRIRGGSASIAATLGAWKNRLTEAEAKARDAEPEAAGIEVELTAMEERGSRL